jgi:SAM-dependent methyltransferase
MIRSKIKNTCTEQRSQEFEFVALEEARNYRRSIVRQFAPYLRGAVLEIGAGIGHITELLVRQSGVASVGAVEPDHRFARRLREKLPQVYVHEGTVESVDEQMCCDTAVCVNVLEHIEDDEAELRRYWKLLRPTDGCLCLFVPAGPRIYSPIDRDFGHFRRYTQAGLTALLQRTGFEALRVSYFNLVGYFCWWMNFCVLKQRCFQPRSVRIFDRLIFPLTQGVERRLQRVPIGQSVLAVARAR